MNGFHDAAYNMAAVSATVALYRALIKKGVLAREEAVRILLDEAVARAIQAESQTQASGVNRRGERAARKCPAAEVTIANFASGPKRHSHLNVQSSR
jgi:hypothetical protein